MSVSLRRFLSFSSLALSSLVPGALVVALVLGAGAPFAAADSGGGEPGSLPESGAGAVLPSVLPASERAAMEATGRVSADVLDLVATGDRVNVLVAVDVDGFASRQRLGAVQGIESRRALGRQVSEAILARQHTAEVRRRAVFRTVEGFAANVTAEGLAALLADPDVRAIGYDLPGGAQLNESLPLSNIDLVRDDLGFTGDGVTVAVIDSGYDADHRDMANDLIAEKCYCLDNGGGCCPDGSTTQSGRGAARDEFRHGTHVASVITSSGITSPQGGAPNAGIVAVRVLDAQGRFCCISDVIQAVEWIDSDQPGVDVVNLSLGTDRTFDGTCDGEVDLGIEFLERALDDLTDRGVAVVSSAGNQSRSNGMSAPACLSNVIGVGGVWDANLGRQAPGPCIDQTTAADQMACFSNRSSTTDVLAGAGHITAARLGGGSMVLLGTSQASAVVAACVAQLREALPNATLAQLRAAIADSPVRVPDPVQGLARTYPRLDCLDALNYLQAIDACGDANLSGAVTTTDALIILQSAVSGGDPPCEPRRCDVDRSGSVAATDAFVVLQIAVGNIASGDCQL